MTESYYKIVEWKVWIKYVQHNKEKLKVLF